LDIKRTMEKGPTRKKKVRKRIKKEKLLRKTGGPPNRCQKLFGRGRKKNSKQGPVIMRAGEKFKKEKKACQGKATNRGPNTCGCLQQESTSQLDRGNYWRNTTKDGFKNEK